MEKLKAATVFFDVEDMDRALTFYRDVLGLPEKIRFGNNWAEVDAGTISIGLHPTEAGAPAAQGGGGIVSFYVDDLEKVREDLVGRGAEPGPVRTPPRGKFFMLKDPDGNSLHFIEFNKNWKQENKYNTQR